MEGPQTRRMICVLVDADACPVKEEIYKVAFRRNVGVTIVSNSPIRVPAHPLIECMVVSDGFDAADDWIAERAGPKAVCITADILLADRCLKAGATVIAPTGKPFTEASIGMALAMRELAAELKVPVLEYPALARSVYFTTRERQVIREELTAIREQLETMLAASLTAGRPVAPQRSCRSSWPKLMPSGSISNCLGPASTWPATRAPMPRPWAIATVRSASPGATNSAKPAPMFSVL